MCISANPKRVLKSKICTVNLTLLVGVDWQTVIARDPTRRRFGNLPPILISPVCLFLENRIRSITTPRLLGIGPPVQERHLLPCTLHDLKNELGKLHCAFLKYECLPLLKSN